MSRPKILSDEEYLRYLTWQRKTREEAIKILIADHEDEFDQLLDGIRDANPFNA